jgi:ketopantoate reductase
MLNVGVNQTCAVYEVPYRGVQTPGKIREIYLAAMEEARACANAEGIDLTEGGCQGVGPGGGRTGSRGGAFYAPGHKGGAAD